MKINNKTEHDANSVLGFKNQYSTSAKNLVKMLPKPHDKYSNNVIKYYEYVTQGSHFNLASASKNSILTVEKQLQFQRQPVLTV